MGGHQHWPPHHDTNWYDPCPLPTFPAPTTFRSGGVMTTCAHLPPTSHPPGLAPTAHRARAVRRSGARHKADPCSTPQNLSGGLLRASRGLDTVCLSIFGRIAGRNQRTATRPSKPANPLGTQHPEFRHSHPGVVRHPRRALLDQQYHKQNTPTCENIPWQGPP